MALQDEANNTTDSCFGLLPECPKLVHHFGQRDGGNLIGHRKTFLAGINNEPVGCFNVFTTQVKSLETEGAMERFISRANLVFEFSSMTRSISAPAEVR